jgi:hypothetical protein
MIQSWDGQFLGRQPVHKPAPFVVAQPRGLSGLVGEIEQDSHRQQERRHRFQDEQLLPAMHAEDPVEPQQRAGYRRADHG